MSTDTTATETKTETIATQQESVVAPITTTEVDYEAALAKKDAELAQIAKEKENYRKAYLKSGGKPEQIQTDTDEAEDMETIIDRKVQERFLATKEAQLQAEKDEIQKASFKRIKELEIALKNRGQVLSNSGQGSNQDKPEGKIDNTLSNDQISDLKSRGWDDKKIEDFKKNLKAPRTMSQ